MPPKRYIIQMKINHAAELLRFGEYKISDVALMSGYSDVYFFSRQFKKYMGISPSDFVKKYKSSK
jgi:YesN/AraC family two-component response regulator